MINKRVHTEITKKIKKEFYDAFLEQYKKVMEDQRFHQHQVLRDIWKKQAIAKGKLVIKPDTQIINE